MKPTLDIQFDREPAIYPPGATIQGQVFWSGATRVRRARVLLFHQSEAKGHKEVAVVAEEEFPHPGTDEGRGFAFSLPLGPPSFEGGLITMRWGIEVLLEPGLSHHEFFPLSPDLSGPITLSEPPDMPTRKWWHSITSPDVTITTGR